MFFEIVVRGNKKDTEIRGPNLLLQNCRMLNYIFQKREEMRRF